MMASTKKAFVYMPVFCIHADPSGRAVSGVGLRPLVSWDRVFESSQGHGSVSFGVLCVVR